LFQFLRVHLECAFVRESPFIDDILDSRHALATLEGEQVKKKKISKSKTGLKVL
jgi:hypothetical protein